MKSRKILSVIILSLVISGAAFAQDCGYYSMSEGTVFSYQSLDAKGKVTGTSRTTCLGVAQVGSVSVFKVNSEYFDAKNTSQSSREFEMRCEDGQFYVDMKNFVDPKSMEAFKGMDISIDSKDMVYPAGFSVGQTLPDASITISAASGGISLLNLFINITNRQVVGTESVTVPAGTFDCYKITYDVETKMMFKMNASVAEYVNMGAGSVKSDTFDKKGKLTGTTQLVEFKR
jgi:hypothetical protein